MASSYQTIFEKAGFLKVPKNLTVAQNFHCMLGGLKFWLHGAKISFISENISRKVQKLMLHSSWAQILQEISLKILRKLLSHYGR